MILKQLLDWQRYLREFKRQIVEASLVSGASIAGVALSYGINANLLHKWRSRYRHGEFGAVTDPFTLAPCNWLALQDQPYPNLVSRQISAPIQSSQDI